jgi:hypothetical protein
MQMSGFQYCKKIWLDKGGLYNFVGICGRIIKRIFWLFSIIEEHLS